MDLRTGLVVLVALTACDDDELERSPVEEDEEVILLPTYAVRGDEGWRGSVHGWVFEPEEGSVLRAATVEGLAAALGVDRDNEVFRERVRWFLVDNEGDKCLIVHHDGGKTEACSGDNGHAEADVVVADRPAEALRTLVIDEAGARDFEGELHLIPAEGLSVVSDIDDTIKITEVTDRDALVRNTFLRPFREAPGMAAIYGRWADEGAAFHYVSSSPWQLYPALRAFMDEVGFPAGTFHLKLFRLTDRSVFDLFAPGTETKPRIIERILDDFPQRTFVFVGDSGEVDPEVYGGLMRDHPGQVLHAYIRDVGGADEARMSSAFEGVPGEKWSLLDAAAPTVSDGCISRF